MHSGHISFELSACRTRINCTKTVTMKRSCGLLSFQICLSISLLSTDGHGALPFQKRRSSDKIAENQSKAMGSGRPGELCFTPAVRRAHPTVLGYDIWSNDHHADPRSTPETGGSVVSRCRECLNSLVSQTRSKHMLKGTVLRTSTKCLKAHAWD